MVPKSNAKIKFPNLLESILERVENGKQSLFSNAYDLLQEGINFINMKNQNRALSLKEQSNIRSSRIAESINERLRQYLQAKDFQFASLGSNPIAVRKKVIITEQRRSPQKQQQPVMQPPHSSIASYNEVSIIHDNYSLLPYQIRKELDSLKNTIQSQELRDELSPHRMPKNIVSDSTQAYTSYNKVKAGKTNTSSSLNPEKLDRAADNLKLPLIEVKSVSPYDHSALLGLKVPDSLKSDMAYHQRRYNKKSLEEKARAKIQSSNNLKLKYEDEMNKLLEYRENKKRSFNDRFYAQQEVIKEHVRTELSEDVESMSNSKELFPPIEPQPSPPPQELSYITEQEPTPNQVLIIKIQEQPDPSSYEQQNSPKKSKPSFPSRKKQASTTSSTIKQYRPPPKQSNTVYQNKIRSYRQFIFLINMAHGRYDAVTLQPQYNMFRSENRLKAYVGRGNNSLLIKSLLKRRFWWSMDEEPKNSQFVWTQLKVNTYFDLERPNKEEILEAVENDEEQGEEAPKRKKRKNKKKQVQPMSPVPVSKFKPTLPAGVSRIFTKKDQLIFRKYEQLAQNIPQQKLQDFDNRLKLLQKKLLPVSPSRLSERMHNHLEFNYYMGNKKAMFYNMRQYYQLTNKNVFEHLPLTFHIKKGLDDREYKHFVKEFRRRQEEIRKLEEEEEKNRGAEEEDEDEGETRVRVGRNIWIVKPGELSNRGSGITVIDQVYELNTILKKKECHTNGSPKTYIVQAYLDKPLLYNGRKFDLRHYMLITTLYGKMRAYWYSQGYVRTSSAHFDLEDLGNDLIHLTNDAIQKFGQDYGRYEQGNKLSYLELQRYLDTKYPKQGILFYQHIYPQMRQVALDAVRASYMRLDPRRLHHNFEVFGLDFMIDRNFKVWLIQINTNPCLEISSGLLGRIIPTMVEQSLRLSLDVIYPPPADYPNTLKHLAPDRCLENLKFELIFDEESEAKVLAELYKGCKDLECGEISEEDETFDNDGKELELDVDP